MRKWIYILLVLLYLFSLYLFFGSDGLIHDEGSLEVFFCQEVNCSSVLIQLIDEDTKCVFYDLGEPALLDVLGKNTLIFEDNYEEGFVSVGSRGLMHHKFCFSDDWVLTGSWNPTVKGTNYNDNLVLLIHSKEIAKIYSKEYNRIRYGLSHVGRYSVDLSGVEMDICFSPIGNCEDLILDSLVDVLEVKFATFTFTSVPIAKALFGKNVEGVIEKSKQSKYSVFNYLAENGVDVQFDNNVNTMHHKFFILDFDKVILGSYNPTKGANEVNDENLLIIRSSELNSELRREFERLQRNI